MKIRQYLLSVLFVVFALTGCAQGPTFSEAAQSMPAMSQDAGRIYFYRTTILGAAITPAVTIDGERVGKAVAGGFFYADRPAGSYVIAASTEAKRSLTLTLKAGEERYVRLEMKMGIIAGHVKPVLVDNSVGAEEIVKTKFNPSES